MAYTKLLRKGETYSLLNKSGHTLAVGNVGESILDGESGEVTIDMVNGNSIINARETGLIELNVIGDKAEKVDVPVDKAEADALEAANKEGKK